MADPRAQTRKDLLAGRLEAHRLNITRGTSETLRCLDDIWTDQILRIEHHLGKEYAPAFLRDGMGVLPPGKPVDPSALTSVTEKYMHTLWERAGSTVYDVHEELFASIMSGKADYLKLPVRVLGNLPHPSPMFLFPRPPRIQLGNGQEGTLAALYVTGISSGRPVLSTDAYLDRLSVLAVSGVHVAPGAPASTDLSLISLSVPGAETIRDAAEASADAYAIRAAQFPGTDRAESAREHVMTIATIASSVMAYAGAVNADVERRPSAPKGTRAPGNPTGRHPVGMMKMGYRFGPEIGAARRAYEQRDRRAEPGTGTKIPHVRGAHPHLYWTGPRGEQVPVVHILDAINVKGGVGGSPVVHRVADRTRRER